jgi:PAS domain S-box-containing protein
MFRLRNRLLLIFVGLAIGPLLVVTGVLSRYTYDTLQGEALASQSATAGLVGTKIQTFIQSREDELQMLSSNIYGLDNLDLADKTTLMSLLLTRQPVYQEVALLDPAGREQVRLSRSGVVPNADLRDRADDPAFQVPAQTHDVYYGPVYFDQSSDEPLMTIAVPVIDSRTGDTLAVLVADFRFKSIGDLIAGLTTRPGEDIYLVDASGRILAYRDPSVVERGTVVNVPTKNGRARGVSGADVIETAYSFQFGEQRFSLIEERPVAEPFRLALHMATVALVATLIALVVAVGLVALFVSQIVRPIVTLAAAARAITAGDLSQRVAITSRDEIGELAAAFNLMSEQLARTWADLAHQVYDLEAARQAQYASEQQIRSIFESTPMGLCMYELRDQDRLVFVGANPSAEEILGIDQNLITGQAMDEAFPWVAGTETLARYKDVARGGRIWRTETVSAGGKRRGTTFEIHAFQTMPGKMVIAFQDITERKRAESQLHERAARLELVAQVGQQTTAILDLGDLLRRAVHLISDTFHYYNVIIRLVEGNRLILRTATLPAFARLENVHWHHVGPGSITGWVADTGKPLLVPDVSQDERYMMALADLQTRSELAVPIKSKGVVIGVLDVQSVERNAFSAADEFTLQIVADQLAIAIENARLYERVQHYAAELEQRVTERTAELAAVNKELEAFAYSVSHDLRAPLRSIDGFSQAILEDYYDKLDADGQDFLRRVRAASQRMSQLIDDLLDLSRLSRGEMHREAVDLSALARQIAQEYQAQDPARRVEWVIADAVTAYGDVRLLRVMLENLIGNAWKFTSGQPAARIEFGYTETDGQLTYFVKDNGAGFDMAYADKLFGAFQRLHTDAEFEGTGIGLATVQRIVHRHGGRVWATSIVGQGATFYFTFGASSGVNG